jgi:hypothetical protein
MLRFAGDGDLLIGSFYPNFLYAKSISLIAPIKRGMTE